MSKNMNTIEQKHEDRISALEDGQKQIIALLEPISETYKTVSKMGKWLVAFIVFISVIIGILAGLKELRH